MGLEVAGVVVATGKGAKRWRMGDRVCALLGGGGYAQYVAVPEAMVMPIPAGLDFAEAASLPEAYATCYLNLFREGQFQPGETLFFPAGASGLASVGIPMARETIGQCFPYVNEGCRWVLISTLAGVTTTVPLRALLTKGITFKGSMLRKRSVAEKGALLEELVQKVWPKLESGAIRPTIYRVLPMERAQEAHAILESGENVGKVVLQVRP